MQYGKSHDIQLTEHELLLSSSKKTPKASKWREIEALQSQRKLLKELQDIDPTYSFSIDDLM